MKLLRVKMCPIDAKVGSKGKPVQTFSKYEDATDWKVQFLKSLALSTEADSRFPLSSDEDNPLSQGSQQFPVSLPMGDAGLINGQETRIVIICRPVKAPAESIKPVEALHSYSLRYPHSPSKTRLNRLLDGIKCEGD